MQITSQLRQKIIRITAAGLVILFCLLMAPMASAQITPMTTENPKAGSFGMEGIIAAPPPTEGAFIAVPSNGASFTTTPVTVSGTCPTGLLVEISNNGVMSGATLCEDGSFSLQVSLFQGQNDLTARVIDDLGQEGPPSNTISVTYNTDAEFEAFGAIITLTSNFSRRAAEPNSSLTWPLQLSGGTGPYAFLIDWGDGTDPQLQSQAVSGNFNIDHVYKKPGIYRVTIKVTDSNGATGFLQVIAVAIGEAEARIANTNEQAQTIITKIKVLWLPALIVLLLLFPAFWLGRRHEMRALRKKLERDAAMIRNLDK